MLTNISRSKGKQTIKYGQLIEYNNKFFLEKAQRNVGKKFPRTFSKKSKLRMSLYQEFYAVCFYFMPS